MRDKVLQGSVPSVKNNMGYLLLVVGAVAGVLFLEGLSIKSLIYGLSVILIFTAGILIGLRQQKVLKEKLEQQRQQERAQLEKERVPHEFIESMEYAIGQLCDLTGKQVDLSREQTEDAVRTLSKRFSGLVKSLTAAVEASKTTASGVDSENSQNNIVVVFERSRDKLSNLVDRMAQSTQMRENLKHQVAELVSHTDDLKNMANSVENIASQTNLLALNAAIEAARAGEMGRGFAVVADEVRELSIQSGKAGEQIVKMVNTVNEAMKLTLLSAEQASIQDEAAETEARDAINIVLKELHDVTGGLAESSSMLKDVSIGIVKEINDILVSLQFQDRVSQILVHVVDSLHQFSDVMADKQKQRVQGIFEKYCLTSLLDSLRKGYTTEEQHRLHDGESAGGPEEKEVEFF